jgi:hypothetical protein
MVREIVASGCDIKFDPAALERANIELVVEPNINQILMNDTDALTQIHDELKRRKLWWLLEILPMHFSWQDSEGAWRKTHGCVLSGRVVISRRLTDGFIVQCKWGEREKDTPPHAQDSC